MCGIAGAIGPLLNGPHSERIVHAMLARIGHRGPDGAGYVIDDGIAMGTVRLSILDPNAGIQPMDDGAGRWWICYNGEIYNYRELRDMLVSLGHRFVTTCDTEVVLRAFIEWGVACLPKLNGGFAFSIMDRTTGDTYLARDRFGKRPLFISRQNGSIAFASEMKAFLDIPGFEFRPDTAEIASILGQWTPLPHQTGFEDIESLPMGHYAVITRDGTMTQNAYEALSFASETPVANEQEAKQAIRERLRRSVELRLRSDVPVGVYLSGGVDSAIVASLVCDVTGQAPSTFSVEFEDAEFDETADQLLVADHLGTSHHAQRISHADIANALPDAVYHAEVPTFRSAFVPMFLLSQRTRAEGIKVVLSGEGADEAFLGYDLFKETLLRSAWSQMDEDMRSARLGRLYPHLSHFGPADTAALSGLYAQFAQEQMAGLFSHEMRFQNGRFSARLLKDRTGPFDSIQSLVAECRNYATFTPVQKAQWLEYKTLLPGYLLSTQGDRMALAHGVENRCPFLDPDVVALSNAVNLKFDDGFDEKRLLREAFRGRVPDAIVDKRKFPYRAPDAAAFAATRPDYLDAVLSEAELARLPHLDARFSARLADKVLNRASEDTSTKENQTFLYLLSMTLLHRQFTLGEGATHPSLPPLQRQVDLRCAA
ncbi:MAG: asparagine synthase (glutamine-hydrolyzing) [Roseovarius sp.]